MASRCYEGFPMAILDAISYGKCVVGPDHGGFSEIIRNNDEPIGELFIPNNVDDLNQKVIALWGNQQRINSYSLNAHKALNEKYSNTIITQKWREIVGKE